MRTFEIAGAWKISAVQSRLLFETAGDEAKQEQCHQRADEHATKVSLRDKKSLNLASPSDPQARKTFIQISC